MTELLSLPVHAYVVLDTLYDDNLIDEGTYLAIMARMPHAAAACLFDGMETYDQRRDHPKAGKLTGKREFAVELTAIADTVIAGLDEPERRAVAALRVRWLARQCMSIAWFYALTSFEDQTTGGALEPWLPQVRLHRDGRPFRKVWARIHDPEFIRRKVTGERETADFAAHARRIMAGADTGQADADLVARWRQRIEEERRIAREANERDFWRQRGHPLAHFTMAPKALAKRRQVLKRAFRTAVRVLPAADVSRFARGESIRLEGQHLDLIVERSGSLAGIGPHHLDITVAARGGGRLADLCLYIDQTPALDQLTGLALAMAAGEDEQIVKDANVIRVYPAGESHPLLLGRKRARVMAAREDDPILAIKDAYVERTKLRYAREMLRVAGIEQLELAA